MTSPIPRISSALLPLASLAALILAGCTDRGNLAQTQGTFPSYEELTQGAETGQPVDEYQWMKLAQQVGLRGSPNSWASFRPMLRGNGTSFPGGGTYPGGFVGGSYPRGAGNWTLAGNGQSYPGGMISFAGMNGSYPNNGRWLNLAGQGSYPQGIGSYPQGNMSYPGANGSYPAGYGNQSYGRGNYFPIRGAGSRNLPLGSPNVSYGSGFQRYPVGPGSGNTTNPR